MDNNFLEIYKILFSLQYSSFPFISDNSVKFYYEESLVFHLIAIPNTVFFFLQEHTLIPKNGKALFINSDFPVDGALSTKTRTPAYA